MSAGGIGIHGFKLAEHPSTKGKKGATGAACPELREAGSERESRSKTLDPDLSCLNEYHGCTTGEELFERLLEWRGHQSEKRQAEGHRALRNDSVIAAEVIIQPSYEFWLSLTDEQRGSFFGDVAEWFGQQGHPIDAWMVHNDEGIPMPELDGVRLPGMHIIQRAADMNGDYIGNKVLGKAALRSFHKELPDFLKAKGYPVERSIIYDPEEEEAAAQAAQAAGQDPDAAREDYQASCKAERERRAKERGVPNGLDANDYASYKATQKAEAAEATYNDATAKVEAIAKQAQAARERADEAEKAARAHEKEAREAIKTAEIEAQSARARLVADRKRLEDEKTAFRESQEKTAQAAARLVPRLLDEIEGKLVNGINAVPRLSENMKATLIKCVRPIFGRLRSLKSDTIAAFEDEISATKTRKPPAQPGTMGTDAHLDYPGM